MALFFGVQPSDPRYNFAVVSDERRTRSVPEDQRPEIVSGGPPIVGLRIRGTNTEFLLSPERDQFRVGAESGCDVMIQNPYISALHCVLERRDGGLLLVDQNSKNGTFRAGHRCDRFELVDGSEFILGTTPLVPFSDRSRRARLALQKLIGYSSEAQELVDAFLATTRTDRPLVLVGQKGSRRAELARVLHDGLPRARRPFVEMRDPIDSKRAQQELLQRAQRGSLFLHAEALPDDREFFLHAIQSGAFDVRLYAAAPDRDVAAASLGLDLFSEAATMHIPPLASRSADIAQLVQALLDERAQRGERAAISETNRAALRARDWPGNLDELMTAIDYATALEHAGSVRKAAKLLGVHRSTLSDRLKRWGFVSRPSSS